MRRIRSFLPLSLMISSAIADIVYVTDLPLFTSLAPCASGALSYNVMSMTYDLCPPAVTELKDCVCTKGANLADVEKALSSSVSWSCGGTASEDQASARTVLSAYCDQDGTYSFPEPATPVSIYITDIPELDFLAPCAASAVSYAVNTLTYDNCPSEAPLLASCACSKNQNSLLVSQIINTSAKYSCSGHTADLTSAQAFFNAYCALNNGTSSFPQYSPPPGDMTYYITDLPEYSSLAPCASRAVSYAVLVQTYSLCPEGPEALGSCACLKDGVSTDISSIIRSSVKYACSAGATEDIVSAFSVYDFYCSAVKGEVTPAGITNSVTQTYPTGIGGGSNGGNNGAPGGSVGGGPQETGGSTSGGANEGPGGKGKDKASSGPSIGLIAGIVVGVVVLLIALAGATFYVIRSKRRQANVQQTIPDNPTAPDGTPDFFNGKQELAATEVTAPNAAAVSTAPPSPSPSTLKVGVPGRMDNISPVSAHASAFTPPPNHAELHGQPSPYPPIPNSAELQGQASPYSPQMPNSAELYGQGNVYPPNRPELQGQGAMYPPPNRPELQGQGLMYPPPNRPELQGHGSPQFPPQNRPELMGYYYPQKDQQQYPQQMPMQQMPPPPPSPMQGYPQHAYTNAQNIPPHLAHGQQPPIELSPMSWQSGPVPGLHEMDAGTRGPPGPPGPGPGAGQAM
ncbi:hypothetical protein V8F20_007617 [Naviculisporaceae sp. PSN 640]